MAVRFYRVNALITEKEDNCFCDYDMIIVFSESVLFLDIWNVPDMPYKFVVKVQYTRLENKKFIFGASGASHQTIKFCFLMTVNKKYNIYRMCHNVWI